MESPKTYSEMLSKLPWLTAIATLAFLIGLRVTGLIPKIPVPEELLPLLKENEAYLSFGLLPLVGAALAWLLSSIYEVHNKLSKVIGLRYVWDRCFIVMPMLRRVGVDDNLNRERVKKIMGELYYPEVKNIDQHYVHVFWRYALVFWVIFEHFWVVTVTIITLWWVRGEPPHLGLFGYLILIFFIMATNWFFVLTRKSQDQADQISEDSIRAFFNTWE